MADPAKPAATPESPGEPSMEEILASIRRILSEDEQGAAAAQPADAPPATDGIEDGVLELTEAMLAPSDSAPAPAPAAPAELPTPPPAPPAAVPSLPPVEPPPAAAEGLLEAGATAAAAAAFGQLRSTGTERAAPTTAWPLGTAGLTVEDLLRQELRPLLSSWLNANLPRIVEEAVAREMERVRARIG